MRFGASLLLTATSLSPAIAQAAPDIAALRQELAELRAAQASTTARIDTIESALNQIEGNPAIAAQQEQASGQTIVANAAPLLVAKPASARVALSGDLRVRYESNRSDQNARGRDRWVMRGRLRASYPVNKWLIVGGQLVTGDPDDPNSSDITLSGFNDDLQVSLDQAYLRGNFGNLQAVAGKFPQPLIRTDLVWDSDIAPQGVSASYKLPLGKGASAKATGLYFVIDESVGGPDSRMVGGQLGFETAASARWKFEMAAGYYDYTLGSTEHISLSGDVRGNLFNTTTKRYLSDFRLLDVVGAVTYHGLGDAWHVRIVGDYVKNFGAATNADQGYGIDVIIGRGSKQHDWRFVYGYAQTETDAVFAAFAHDNTTLAINYRQHTFGVDFALTGNLVLNATLYHYQPLNALNAGNDPNDWLNRLRLNILASF
jgi:hypothetical protein